MAYATAQELKDRLVALGPSTRTAANLPDPQLDAAIDDAALEVNAALGRRYTLPPQDETAPDMVRTLTLQVAVYVATLEARGSADLADTDPVALRYKRAKAMLDGIAAGRYAVPDLTLVTDGEGALDAYGEDTVPDVGLTVDVVAPTYWGTWDPNWRGSPPPVPSWWT